MSCGRQDDEDELAPGQHLCSSFLKATLTLAAAPAAVASSETCSRCRTNRPSIVVRVMSFCTLSRLLSPVARWREADEGALGSDCFLRSCFARFKGGFRPARMLKTAGKQPSLLLCCSGGQAST